MTPISVQPASNIISVWNIVSQSGGGVVSNQMNRHPEESLIKQDKVIHLPEINASWTIPQLPWFTDTVVKLSSGKDRGVVDHYMTLSHHDLDVVVAAIVVTELPENMQSTQAGFDAVQQMLEQSAQKAGIDLTLGLGMHSVYGDMLDLIVPYRQGSSLFPTSGYTLGSPDGPVTLGSSRWAVVGDKLIEWALIIPIDLAAMPTQDLYMQYTDAWTEAFVSTLQIHN